MPMLIILITEAILFSVMKLYKIGKRVISGALKIYICLNPFEAVLNTSMQTIN